MSKAFAIALATLLLTASHLAADWPQFLGPDRNGAYRGAPIVTSFPASGPKIVWSKQVGQGLAGQGLGERLAADCLRLWYHSPYGLL